jgi:hypothetical protein
MWDFGRIPNNPPLEQRTTEPLLKPIIHPSTLYQPGFFILYFTVLGSGHVHEASGEHYLTWEFLLFLGQLLFTVLGSRHVHEASGAHRLSVGDSCSPCADRGCTDSCSTEGKAHWHNILTWFGKLPTSTGESPYYLEIEKVYNKYMEEDHSTPSSLWCSCSCCNGSPSLSLGLSTALTALSHLFLSHVCL